ncbi:MAG: hypothetical protein IPK16_21000 [Anaerolineales bacterium]|nr:hypothetical protein [Anaerolineales bacterium]
MRIVTYNIHGWRSADGHPNLDAVTDVLRTLNADLIGLNEVFYPRVIQGSARPALEALAEQLGMHFVFGPCLRWPAEHNMPAEAYGNAILSRWPIIANSAHHLTSKEEDPQNLLAKKEQRGLLEGRIRFEDGRTFTVYQTHLDHTDETVRAIQLRIARTWLCVTATGPISSWATSTLSRPGTSPTMRMIGRRSWPIPLVRTWQAMRGGRK